MSALPEPSSYVERARKLSAGGSPDAAVALLRRRLSGWNPYRSPARPGVRDLAEFYVELAGSDPAEDATIGWAAYVHRATLWLGGDGTATADSLADLVGRRGRAKVDGQTVITAIAEEHEIAAARLSVAALLQAGGLCVAAEKETLAALTQCATHHEETPDVTLAALSGALALVDLCARPGQRLSLLNAYAAFIPSPNRLRRDGLPTREEIATHQETCEIRRRRTR